MSRFFSKRFCSLEAYVPGEQPTDMKYVKLNTNESPYQPSKGVLDAVKNEALTLNLYSDPTAGKLKNKAAETFNVKPENIFLSNGSDEALSFAFMAFCDKDNGIIFPEISYGFYKVFAELYNLPYKQIPLAEDFSINTTDYCEQNSNIVIANPNAPTGLCLTLEQIEKIVVTNKEKLVIIDEAYIDFGGESCIPLTKKYDNLLVVGTFSKSRSLAGARLGYAIGNESIINDLETIKYSTNPYNINRLTLEAGFFALCDNDYYMDNCKKIIQTRTYTADVLKSLGFTVLDSKTNFVFAKPNKISGKDYYLKLKEKGVLVRHFNDEKISDFVRITIGTKQQMDILIEKTKEILKG